MLTGAPRLTTTATATSGVGSYVITVAQGTLKARNYRFAFNNGTLAVTPARLTITADIASRAYWRGQPGLHRHDHRFR